MKNSLKIFLFVLLIISLGGMSINFFKYFFEDDKYLKQAYIIRGMIDGILLVMVVFFIWVFDRILLIIPMLKNRGLIFLFCVFGLNLNAQVYEEGMLIGTQYHDHEPKNQKFFIGFNFAPQINVIDFKSASQGLPLHTLVWYDATPSTSLALGYTVNGSNLVQALILPDWYVVNLINTAGSANFIGIGYTLTIPDTKEALFFELGSNYDRRFSSKSFNCTISAGIFITRRFKIL